ncbi:MAG: DNA translocase FtsK [Lachnospiraceae bacterium]|nr:DNA translocase FtsK [Lachnospiraceae bacterium]
MTTSGRSSGGNGRSTRAAGGSRNSGGSSTGNRNRYAGSGAGASGGNRNTSGNRSASASRTASRPAQGSTSGGAQKRKMTPVEEALSQEREDELMRSVLLVMELAVLIFLFLCNFHLMGSFGSLISGFLFGVFGSMAYVFPIALGVLLVIKRIFGRDRRMNRKLWASFGIFLLLEMTCDLIAGFSRELETYSLPLLYTASKEALGGGGIIGGSLSYALSHFLGIVGTVLVMIACLAIFLILLSERSLIEFFRSVFASMGDGRREREEYYEPAPRQIPDNRRRSRGLPQEGLGEESAAREQLPGDAADGAMALPGESADAYGDAENAGLPGPAEVPVADRSTRAMTESEKLALRRQKAQEKEAQREAKAAQKREAKELKAQQREAESILRLAEPPVHTQEMHELTMEDTAEDGVAPFPVYNEPERPAHPGFLPESLERKIPVRESHAVNISGMEELQPEESYDSYDPYDSYEPEPEPAAPAPAPKPAPVYHPIAEAEPEPAPAEDTRAKVKKPEEQKMPAHGNEKPMGKYQFPSYNLLKPGVKKGGSNRQEIAEISQRLVDTLNSFGVNVTIADVSVGPTVTRYEMIPEQGVKVSKIVGLSDDIKLSLAAADIRIEAPIPGKSAVGIEVPNRENSPVALRDLLESQEFRNFNSTLAFAVGKDIAGKPIVADIGKMPHVLIAGATGSGKSVCINTLIMSLLYKSRPDEVQLILIDPKVVELSVYNRIPHLIMPVVTDPHQASATLQWAVTEMERRYRLFADAGVRDLAGYNDHLTGQRMNGEDVGPNLYKLVIIIDELADLMMVASKDVEESICRLAQLARAAGIHLVVATQRPSVNVITGLIKANMPSRIAFAVSSGVDSRTILDSFGAEKLLGKGDMLFYPQGYTKPARLQGAFVSDDEVSKVVEFLANQRLHNDFAEEAQSQVGKETQSSASDGGASSEDEERDPLFEKAGWTLVRQKEDGGKKASIGYLQRALKIGFNRAARIMDALSDAGVIGPDQGTSGREILMSPQEFEMYLNSLNQ